MMSLGPFFEPKHYQLLFSSTSPKVEEIVRQINKVQSDMHTEAQQKYAALFWKPTSHQVTACVRINNESGEQIQHKLLAQEYNQEIADFLLGHVVFVTDVGAALELFIAAFNKGFKPAEDSLVSWCDEHYQPKNEKAHFFNSGSYTLGIKIALTILTSAAEHENPTAHYLLGLLNLRKSFEHANENEAIRHLQLAYDLGHREWNLKLGEAELIAKHAHQLWCAGDYGVINVHESAAITLFEIAGEEGHSTSINRLVSIYTGRYETGLFDSLFNLGNKEKLDHWKSKLPNVTAINT